MAINSNVYSQGSGGGIFENEVQSSFFVSFLLGLSVPGVNGIIVNYRQQSGSLGYHTDDLFLGLASNESTSKVIIQIKHSLTISAKGHELKEVIANAWRDFQNTDLFDRSRDKFFIIKHDLTAGEKKHLTVMLDWSRAKSDPEDFYNEVNRLNSKKHYLNIFKSIIEEEFPESYNNSDLFYFFKTLYFLEFDLGTDNSTTLSNLFSLITHYKKDDQLSAKQIWASVCKFIGDNNPKGGQIDDRSIPEDLSRIFNKFPASQTLKLLSQLSEQNMEAVDMVENTIGRYTLPRISPLYSVNEVLRESQILIISGDPGCGKSAIAKAYIQQTAKQLDGFILCFKADEFSEGHLKDYFNKHNINLTLKEIFSLFSTFSNNLIYIDAMEKLLEANGYAFNELLFALKDIPNIKLLITCRASSLGLIELKYLSPVTPVKLYLQPLSDDELDQIFREISIFGNLAGNRSLRSLLKYPKYLDFAYRAINQGSQDFGTIDEERFKEQLWTIIIENKINEYREGLPERRSKIFINIAVSRSRQMQPFASIIDDDPEALEKLVKENVVVRSSHHKLYAPAHDVLEDWALVKFVSDLYHERSARDAFFSKLGNEPAMRRAYRLWVQSVLKRQDQGEIQFVTQHLFDNSGPNFWRDESLIAILYSDYCPTFLITHKSNLVKDNFGDLFRLIQVMRTSCRENLGNFHAKKYVPRGYGWASVLKLLNENITAIEKERYDLLYQIVKDWSTIINSQDELPDGTREAGLILLFLLKEHINVEDRFNNLADEAVQLLALFAGGLNNEIETILNEDEAPSDDEEEDEDVWYGDRLKSRLIKVALNGIHSRQLAKYLPDQLFKLAKNHWMLTTSRVRFPQNEQERFFFGITREHGSMDHNHHFGLKKEHDFNYLPPSAYQTPILSLLRFHPNESIVFITELINWCTENYKFSEFSSDDNCCNVELDLSDGTKVEQFGSSLLWQIYRGTGKVSPYVLQSILMALEYYLLELCQEGTEAVLLANNLMDYLYRNSSSIATVAVIASVCQAYPEHTAQQIVPLLSVRKLISWDVNRYTHDYSHSHFSSFEPVFDDERIISDKLPHRKKYYGGLRGFFPLYSYSYGTVNEQLFLSIDRHRLNAAPDDYEWRKILDELDFRTWRVTSKIVTDETVSFQVEPSYDESLKGFVDDLKKEANKHNDDDTQANWIWKVRNKDIKPDLDRWKEAYQYYLPIEEYNFIHHQPGKLAEIGIVNFWPSLDTEQKAWCLKTVNGIVNDFISKAYNPYNMDFRTSTLDYEAAFNAFPILLGYNDLPERADMEVLGLHFLTAPFQENDINAVHFWMSVKDNLWKENQELAEKYLSTVLKFAEFNKTNSIKRFRPQTEEEENKYWDAYQELIERAANEGWPIEIEKLDLEKYSMFYLNRASRIVPDQTENTLVFDLIRKLLDLYLANEAIESRERNERENSQFSHQFGMNLQHKISTLILWNDNEPGKALFSHLLDSANTFIKSLHEVKSRKLSDIYKFFNRTVENIILLADKTLPIDDNAITQNTKEKFTSAWRTFLAYLVTNNSMLFSDLLLLDIDVHWRNDATHWKPLEQDLKFYNGIVQVYGAIRMSSTIVLLSHIGDQVLLMGNLQWLINTMKNPKIGTDLAKYRALEQLVNRVYQNHLSELLNDRSLFEEFLWLLDQMVAQQSSDAYWIREFLLGFKKATN